MIIETFGPQRRRRGHRTALPIQTGAYGRDARSGGGAGDGAGFADGGADSVGEGLGYEIEVRGAFCQSYLGKDVRKVIRTREGRKWLPRRRSNRRKCRRCRQWHRSFGRWRR